MKVYYINHNKCKEIKVSRHHIQMLAVPLVGYGIVELARLSPALHLTFKGLELAGTIPKGITDKCVFGFIENAWNVTVNTIIR